MLKKLFTMVDKRPNVMVPLGDSVILKRELAAAGPAMETIVVLISKTRETKIL